jgi:hypothetical protein
LLLAAKAAISDPSEGGGSMAAIHVEVSRTVDRDWLMRTLEARGLDPRPTDDDGRLGVELRCEGDGANLCHELYEELEGWIAATGLALVPTLGRGAIVVRPAAG